MKKIILLITLISLLSCTDSPKPVYNKETIPTTGKYEITSTVNGQQWQTDDYYIHSNTIEFIEISQGKRVAISNDYIVREK